jgi:hypothetical protein
MAKLLSGTRIYGNAAVDTFITVGGTIYAGNIVIDSITANTWFRLYTANISESLTNLFYTNARVIAAVVPWLDTANVRETNGNLYYTNARVISAITPLLTTSNVIEVSNLYFTAARVNATVQPFLTTANVSELTNQYFTNVRVLQAVTPVLTTANVLELTNQYFTNTRVLQAVTPVLTTSNVIEGSNLYFTPQRAIEALRGNNVTVNNLVVSGDLEIQGNVVTVNAATLNIEDKNILIANGAINSGQADGAGITIAGANANITYQSTGDKFVINKPLDVTGNINGTNAAFLNGDPVITLNPLNQSISVLRSQLDAPTGNVLYVSGNGDDRNSGYSLANALANIHTALNKAESWTTVFVKSGDYVLYNQPVTIKKRVGMVGDNLRTTTIRPSERTKDMFYVNNACYVTGFTFRDHLAPAAVFSYNPDGSAGFITTSPYIQNSSSITTTGTGMRVNGAYVSGLRSMVVDSYTQTNEGGIGMHMLNRGYTQLVSVFTICCDIAILAEDGGFCSITNSNASFGRLGLVARGVSNPLNFGNFDRVEETDAGTFYVFKNLNIRPNYGDAVLFANYSKAKCERDTGLIVDSLAIDLAYGSNTQSTFAGLQYWAQTSSAIPNQSEETLVAINYAKNLASNIVQNITITPLKQANVTQVSATAGDQPGTVAIEFDLIANIITNGTVGVTDIIVPNQYPANTNVGAQRTANLLFLNKNFIAAETVAYVRQAYPGFFGNASYFIDAANSEATCTRDVGYLLDSVAFDVLHGGNRQAIMAGTYYYNYNTGDTQIDNQVVQTGAAYNYIASIITDVVRNKKNAFYNQEKCERDTGLIVDSLAFDLAYTGNSQSNFAGLQYWSQSTSDIQNQQTQTIAAINYAKRLVSNIITNTTVTSTKQANVIQVTGTGGTTIERARVDTDFDLVANIINSGTVGVTDRIIPNQYPANTSINVNNGANLIIANKGFVQAEVVAFINQTYPGFFANANNFVDAANAQATCSRDVGYILDSITFDLRHDGNKQAVQAGTYYYNYTANVTQINNQIVQTGAAYNFIGSIIDEIITGVPVANVRQTLVVQNTTAASAATLAEANIILQKINLITNIITYGPNVSVAKTPISGNASSNINIINATKLILANKEFIKAETIAYINDVLFDPPYQITVRQNTTAFPAATYAEANLVINNINLITNIIANGPSVAPPKRPISYTPSTTPNVINAAKIILANRDYIVAEVSKYVDRNWSNISNGSVAFYTVANASPLTAGNVSYVKLLETVTAETILSNASVSFHQPSYISALGYTFEYIGSGTVLAQALPYAGGIPIQANEVTEEKGGRVYFTSTDQQGDFRIGENLVFNRVDGTISGRTFTKALFATMTPYILAIEG